MFNNEQWKSDGDCSICRRKEYCRKSCSASEARMKRVIKVAINATSMGIAGTFIKSVANGINKK